MDPAVLNDEIDLLASLPLFSVFERDALRLIAFSADTRILRAGDVLFRKNENSDAGFLMLSGTVTLDEGDDGSPSAAIYGRGSLIGQYALLAPTMRPATAVMREPGAVLKITRTLMTRVLDTYPETAERLRSGIAADIQNTIGDIQKAAVTLERSFAG